MITARIAFVASANALDKRSWSGIHYQAFNALRDHFSQVEAIEVELPVYVRFFAKVRTVLTRKLLNRNYDYSHSRWYARAYVRELYPLIRGGRYDLIFGSAATTLLSELTIDIPIVLLSDATVQRMIDYYPSYSNLTEQSKRESLAVESEALTKASVLLYASDWAAKSAIDYYGIASEMVYSIPLGANISGRLQTNDLMIKKSEAICRVLFLGVEWERKGGDFVLQVLREMRMNEVPVELVICGCVPPVSVDSDYVTVIPFLNKNDEKDKIIFDDLMHSSHFLLVPSKAECFGLVYCEAAANGVISVARNTGGVASAVKDGVSGKIFSQDVFAHDVAIWMQRLFADKDAMKRMMQSAILHYETELNWTVWGQRVSNIIGKVLKK